MAVIINELEAVPAAPESRPRGDGANPGGGGGDAPSPAELIQALRREESRRARLWAD
jgi:hypothetical protein